MDREGDGASQEAGRGVHDTRDHCVPRYKDRQIDRWIEKVMVLAMRQVAVFTIHVITVSLDIKKDKQIDRQIDREGEGAGQQVGRGIHETRDQSVPSQIDKQIENRQIEKMMVLTMRQIAVFTIHVITVK